MISEQRQSDLMIEVFIIWATWSLESGTEDQVINKAKKLGKEHSDLTLPDILNAMSDAGIPCRLIQTWIDTTELKHVIEFKKHTIH